MNKNVEAPCEACGGLLPLKAIQTSHRGERRQSCSLHPMEKKFGQIKEETRGKASHRPQTEQGSTSQSERTRVLRRRSPLSSTSDGQAEVMCSRNCLNYELTEQLRATEPSVLEKSQAAFVHQKMKTEVIPCSIHGDQRPTGRRPNSPIHQAQSQARQRPVSQFGSVVKRKQEKTLSPRDIDLPCHLHQHEGNSHNESTCMKVISHLPQEDASTFSSNLRVSISHKVHVATQCCAHKLAANKQKGHVLGEPTAAIFSHSGSTSIETYNELHGALDQHHAACRSRVIAPAESYPDISRLYEECHLHHVEENLTASQRSSSRNSGKLQRCSGYPEQGSHTQPQIISTCRQRVRRQSVVQHHEVCHLYRDNDYEPLAPQSPISRGSTKLCGRCGLPERRRRDFSPQGAHDHSKATHHSPTRYAKIESLCTQRIIPGSGVLSPCILHGDCGSGKIESCGISWHPKLDHINVEAKTREDHKSWRRGKIQGCHLHQESSSNPKRQEPKDPTVWTPGPVTKPRPYTSVRWLERIIASQSIPPQIIREFLQGRRGWPPESKKQKCLGCIIKLTDEHESLSDSYPREFDVISWNPGFAVTQTAVNFVKEHPHERLHRLLIARTQIVKPVVKLSTSKEMWRSRKELQFCSECWNPTKFGRWGCILVEMSKKVSEVADMSTCDTKFPSCRAHGNPNQSDTRDVNLHRPELFSTFKLRLKTQKLQNEIFDRSTALQIAQQRCINLDKKALAHVPEKISPPRVDRTKQESPSLRKCHDAIAQKRLKPYVGLTKIVQPPNPICRAERAPREVAVQKNRPKLMPKPPALWSANDFYPEKVHSQVHSQVPAKPKAMLCPASQSTALSKSIR